MIPKHEQFIAAINDKKKVSVRFYSPADGGVLDRICAPMSYGRPSERQDELNRYWLWDYASTTDSHTLGLVPQQILDLQVLGTGFDPAEFTTKPSLVSVPATGGLPTATAAATGGAAGLKL